MKIIAIKEIPGIDQDVLDYMNSKNHEKVVFCSDESTNLKAIIAIHNTNLGPALGGTRMWQYKDVSEATKDVLRLSRGMTYKAAITGSKIGKVKQSIDLLKKIKKDFPESEQSDYVEVQIGRLETSLK